MERSGSSGGVSQGSMGRTHDLLLIITRVSPSSFYLADALPQEQGNMPFGVDRKMYERRLAEFCAGSPENNFDAWLRERFYPVVALFTA